MTLRAQRRAAGLTQAELAQRAGVSRQLVGAVETERHLPRVDAAMALAAALGIGVGELFALPTAPVDILSGTVPDEGAMLRTGSVGELNVSTPVRIGDGGWGVADGVIEHGALTRLGGQAPGLVVAGCEPGLRAVEQMLREQGAAAVAAGASSAAAIDALAAGRVHAAVVHGPHNSLPVVPADLVVDRYHLATWRVGLAGPTGAPGGWWNGALFGEDEVVQREEGAGVQRAFEHAAERTHIPGPRVDGHVEAARRAVLLGMAAVTMEPAALALGAVFYPLEVHFAELWVTDRWRSDRVVGDAMNVITGRRFQRALLGIGGYDLTGCGSRTG